MNLEKYRMRNFMAVFITTLVFGLWLIPAFMIYHQPINPDGIPSYWGLLYLPICIFTILWMMTIRDTYFKNKE